MKLPIGVSVPHGGALVPDELRGKFLLDDAQVAADGDFGSPRIYALEGQVQRLLRCAVARAVVDMNRAADDDQRDDGVFKACSIYGDPVWAEPLTPAERARLLRDHHRPYHDGLRSFVGAVKLGLDCHTMSDVGPPIGPDPGSRRPLVCLGDAHGTACPRSWVLAMQECFARYLGSDVTINEPFAGGYITRSHGPRMPWMQIEISRTEDVSIADKHDAVRLALRDWCRLELRPEPYGTSVA